MINNMDAFKQMIDFEEGYSHGVLFTDGDVIVRLPNDTFAFIESKKNSDAHSVDNIIKSDQWKTFQDFIDVEHNSRVYLLYVTHDEEISDKLIPFSKLTVRHIEYNGTVEDVEIPLIKYLDRIGSIGRYYIRLTYPNGDKHYCLFGVEGKYSTPDFACVTCTLGTLQEAEEYVNKRFEKEFNREYTYSIYQVKDSKHVTLIKECKYDNNPEGLDGHTWCQQQYKGEV